MKNHFTRPQRMTIVQGIFSVVFIVDILQMWLIIATMDSYLGGAEEIPLPAALFSLICFAANLGLLNFLYAVDRTTGDTRAVRAPHRGGRP